jgi:hypothetical protein
MLASNLYRIITDPNILTLIAVPPKVAAMKLGVSARTLKRMRDDGNGPLFKKDSYKRILYPWDELVAWSKRGLVTNSFHADKLLGLKGAA